jgi:hypothetical protein
MFTLDQPFKDRREVTEPRLWLRFFRPLRDEITAIDDDDTNWQFPTLGNSWTNYNTASWEGAAYRRVQGVVFLQGLIKGGTTGQNIFVLPDGYRPVEREIFVGASPVGTSAGVSCRLDVYATGEVRVAQYFSSGTNNYVSLSGIRFHAAD